jgi:PAS domain-containing protein
MFRLFFNLLKIESYLLAAVPVQTDEFQGPIAVVAIVGKRLENSLVSDMANRAQLCCTLYSYNNKSNWDGINGIGVTETTPITPNIVVNKWQNTDIGTWSILKVTTPQRQLINRQCWQLDEVVENTLVLTEERLGGYNLYNDIYNAKSIVFRIDISRSINSLASYSIIIVLSILATVGVGFSILIGVLLEVFVLCRVSVLTYQIRKIRESKDISKRVKGLKGLDELDFLTFNINEMLKDIETTQLDLQGTFNKLGYEEEKTRLMLNSIPDSISIIRPMDGAIMEVNSSFEKLFSDNWKGKKVYDILPNLPVKEIEQAVGRTSECESIGQFGLKIPVSVLTCGINFFEEGEKIPYVLCIVRDMRERNDVLDKLQREMEMFSKIEKEFTFEEQFRDPIIREAFAKFCEKEKTIENVYFLIAAENYKKLDQASRIKNQQTIFETFMSEKSKYSLNISSEAFDITKKKVKNGLGQIDLFSELEKAVKFNLISESFSRFQLEKEHYIDIALKERETKKKKNPVKRKTSTHNLNTSDDNELTFFHSHTGDGSPRGKRTPDPFRSPEPTRSPEPELSRKGSDVSLDGLDEI